jgi:energy-coupling factor transport system permease protein
MARVSTPMRITLVAIVAALSITALPYRLWKPQLIRLAGLCAFIFCFAAFGSDAVAPVMSDRAPTAATSTLTQLATTASSSSSTTGTNLLLSQSTSSLIPTSMVDVIGKTYNYVVLNLGPFSVTKRSLNLAITLSGLMFVALQCASLCLITTPPEKMALAVGRGLRPLGIFGVPVKELVLTVLLALRFMATVFEEARNLCLGLASRGIDWALLGGKGTLALTVSTASRLFSNLLARSDNIATAMTARGFRGPEEHELHLASGDTKVPWRILADGVALASLAGLYCLSRYVV